MRKGIGNHEVRGCIHNLKAIAAVLSPQIGTRFFPFLKICFIADKSKNLIGNFPIIWQDVVQVKNNAVPLCPSCIPPILCKVESLHSRPLIATGPQLAVFVIIDIASLTKKTFSHFSQSFQDL